MSDAATEIERLRALLAMASEFTIGKTPLMERTIIVATRGDDRWAVTCCGLVWARQPDGGSEFEYEPRPSNREEDFLQRSRYSLEEALEIGRRLVETGPPDENRVTLQKAGKTVN